MPRAHWEKFDFSPNEPNLEALASPLKQLLNAETDIKFFPIYGGAENRVIRDCLSLLVTGHRQILVEHPTSARHIDVEVISNFAEFLRVHALLQSLGGKPACPLAAWKRRHLAHRLRQLFGLAVVLAIFALGIYLIYLKGIWMALLLGTLLILVIATALFLLARSLKNMH